jgi:hypothetical protein
MKTQSSLTGATAAALASYWHHHNVVEGVQRKLDDIWRRTWDEASPFTSYGSAVVQAFVSGPRRPELSTEVRRGACGS